MTREPNVAPDTGAFHAFEQAGWSREAVVATYETSFGRLTRLTVPALLDAVRAGPDVDFLDIATGPGFAAASAAERGARVIGVDFSPGMIEAARRNYPALDFRIGDALALDFPEARFDAAVINYGVLHFEQPERAIAEAFRVLRPGGRAAFTVWCDPQRAVAFGLVLKAVQDHGDAGAPIPPGPYFFRFSSHDEWRDVLGRTGFVDIQVRDVAQDWTFASPEDVIVAFEEGTVRTGGLLKAQTADQLVRIREAVGVASREYALADGTLKMPMPAVLASGVKPRP